MAVGAGTHGEEAVQALHALGGARPGHGLLDGGHGVAVGGVEVEELAGLGGDGDRERDLGAVHDGLALGLRESGEGHVDAHAQRLGDVPHPADAEDAPAPDGALAEGQGLIGHERGLVDLAHLAGALAARAGAVGVEGEGLRARLGELRTAGGTVQGPVQGDVNGGLVQVAARARVVAQARVGQAQGVEDLRRGAEGGAHAGDGRALVEGQGRGHVLDGVDVGAGGLGQAAARVGGQGLQVAARALGVEDAEREGGLARPGDAGHRDDPAQGDGDVEVAQVVDAGAAHVNGRRTRSGWCRWC